MKTCPECTPMSAFLWKVELFGLNNPGCRATSPVCAVREVTEGLSAGQLTSNMNRQVFPRGQNSHHNP